MENKTINIYKKLFEAKKEIGKISKDSTNPFFKSSYLSLNGLLDAVEEVLTKHNLVLLQPLNDGYVSTQIHCIETEQMVNSAIELPNIQDPQKLGSAITYYRRYTLQSLLGLQAEDDDGNSASKQAKKASELIPTPKRLTTEQVAVISTSTNLESLNTALKTYVLQPTEKAMILKRIKELE